MLSHPALVAALVGRDAQRKAFFAQQHIPAVAGVDRNDGVVLREVADIPLFFHDVAFAVQAAHPVVTVAQGFQHILAHPGHDGHIQHDVDGVGQLDAVFGEGRPHRTHGIGDDVHRTSLVAAAGDIVEHFIRFIGIHPVIGGAGLFLGGGADKGTALHPGHVVDRGAVEIAAGQFLLVELEHLAGGAGFGAQGVQLILRTVDPNDLVGLHERDLVLDPGEDGRIFGQCVGHRMIPFL